jgi:hypothetical protein
MRRIAILATIAMLATPAAGAVSTNFVIGCVDPAEPKDFCTWATRASASEISVMVVGYPERVEVLGFCESAGLDAVVEVATARPELRHLPATTLVHRALVAAWPCR